MTDCPFTTLRFFSRVLDRDVLVVKDRMRLVPRDVVVLSWDEAIHLLDSGVTSADLPRLMAIREQFSGRFGDSATPRHDHRQTSDRQVSPPKQDSDVATPLSQGGLFDDL